MEKIDDNYPQFIAIDEDKKKNYLDPIVKDPASKLYKRELTEVYFLAVALGNKYQIKEKSKKIDGFRVYNSLNDRYKLFIRIVVLNFTDYDYEILRDGNKTLKIIEEYANGGASLLFDKIFKSGLEYSLDEELWDEIKSIKKD